MLRVPLAAIRALPTRATRAQAAPSGTASPWPAQLRAFASGGTARRLPFRSQPLPTPRPTAPVARGAPRRPFHGSPRPRDAKKPGSSSPGAAEPEKPLGLSGRLKKLSKEYGWAAFGVYMALSVLDFPFCFLLVRVVGTDKIGEIEHWVTSHVKAVIPQSIKDRWHAYQHALKEAEREQLGSNEISQDVEMAGWGVEKAQAAHQSEASLGTQLALAYAIHKSFIFIRVPLTAAITPKIVQVLRSWGWKIGKKAAGKR